jgi:predicted CopG family antitoxin
MPNYNKKIWEFLKSLGLFEDFETYKDWKKAKYGKESLEDFKEELSEKDRRQFEFLFENGKNNKKSAFPLKNNTPGSIKSDN